MAYNNIISRSDAQSLIPEVVSNEIIGNLTSQSAAMQMFRRLPVSTNQTRLPVLSALPTAYFLNGDTDLKQTTEVNWANKFLNVEEIAAIVPIPENVLNDASFDVWGAIRPLLEQAIGRTLDAAIFFGTNKPSSWPTSIAAGAAAASNTVNRGTNAAAAGGIAGDLSDLFALIEADGYYVDGVAANVAYRGRLRQARSTQGEKLEEVTSMVSMDNVFGIDVAYPMRGLWPSGTGTAEAFAGEFDQGILGVRQDITYKLLDQAVIQASDGTIQFNLAQQDMVALRVVFRCAWQVANVINYDNANSTTRYPFAALLAP